ncbi:hypothetical protein SNE40_016777 [Patella caerulea]|uniref:Uncharacterized protein n=1 Tax=Patella caerulea TaxID=87958 RepID=A0AAN8JDW9_PATCE
MSFRLPTDKLRNTVSNCSGDDQGDNHGGEEMENTNEESSPESEIESLVDTILDESDPRPMMPKLLKMNQSSTHLKKRARDDITGTHNELGEFHTTFQTLKQTGDEELFFNYARRSRASYDELVSLILPRLQSPGSNWCKPITAEEKLK